MADDINQLYLTIEYMNHRRCTPQWTIKYDKIRFVDLTYVVRGKATYFINGQAHSVGAGDLICIPYGSEREAYCDANDLIESYCLNIELFDYNTRERVTLPFDLVTHIGMHSQIIVLMDELYAAWLMRESRYDLQSMGYAYVILSKFMSIVQTGGGNQPTDQRVQTVTEYIVKHSAEPLNVTMLADLVGLHPNYLSSLFRKCCGCTICQYILRIRVNRAESMLLEETLSVGEIATRCGFSNVYYFSRAFKRVKGVSSSSLKKLAKSDASRKSAK